MTEKILAKPAHKMTTEELLGSFLSTFHMAIDPGSPQDFTRLATAANKEIAAELAKRIDGD